MAGQTNATALSYAIEETPGNLPAGTPDWFYLEPNDIGSFGASITTVARNPISDDRMAKKGAITDLDASVDFDSDLTVAAFDNFIEGFLFSSFQAQQTETILTSTTSAFTHAAITALSAGDLVYTREMVNSENNGLFLVNGSPTTTSTPVDATLVAEASAPSNAQIDYAGFQGATGDLSVDSSGDLVSAGAIDFTADITGAGLLPGMKIYIGDGTTDNSFGTAGTSSARIRVVEAGKLTLDKQSSSTWGTDSGATKTIRVFVGSWVRNVPLSDVSFLNRTFQMEGKYDDLDINGDLVEDETGYEYVKGCQANQLTLNMPLTDKVTVGWAFLGLDQEEASGTRKTGTWASNTDTDAFNTTSDFANVSFTKNTDGSTLGAYFKDMTLTINNNISPEKILGTLGAYVMNIGDLAITMSTQVLFTSLEATNAVRGNETISLSWALENDDGALFFDIPSMTLGSANKTFPRNEAIKIDIEGTAFKDTFFGYVLSVTKFPYLPIAG